MKAISKLFIGTAALLVVGASNAQTTNPDGTPSQRPQTTSPTPPTATTPSGAPMSTTPGTSTTPSGANVPANTTSSATQSDGMRAPRNDRN